MNHPRTSSWAGCQVPNPYQCDEENMLKEIKKQALMAAAIAALGLTASAGYAMAGQFPVGCDCDPDVVPKEKCTPPAPPAPPVAGPKPAAEKIKLAADTLFDFDKATLRPEGKAKLDDLVAKSKQLNLEVILAVGHTDRIGSDSYNQKLSEKRAASVKDYLVSKGIEPNRIYTEGKGEKQPVTGTTCNKMGPENGKNAKLVACLQPDRRVEIELIGTK